MIKCELFINANLEQIREAFGLPGDHCISHLSFLQGSVKNNLVEFGPKFAVDLIDLIEQVSEDSETAGIASYFEDFCE